MADVSKPSVSSVQIEEKTSIPAATRPKPKISHPTTAVMVNSAVKNLKDRGGSSLQAIKKYISVTYKVDAEKLAPFIRKFIKNSVLSGALIQTKGSGASGSFKLATESTTKKVVKSAAKVTTKAASKQNGRVQRAAKKVKISAPKAKKTARPPTKKPKTPKPKTVKTKSKTVKTPKH